MSDDVPDLVESPPHQHRIVLVTGPSGAGRTTAINVLEDLGFETISNLPLSLLPRLLEGPPPEHSLALGLDIRNRDFSVNGVLALLDSLEQNAKVKVELLYLDCREDVLIRRYSETRRRHPMAKLPGDGPGIGVVMERDILVPIQARADILIDTSDLSPHELKEELKRWFDPSGTTGLSVSVQSFSFKRGIPRSVDMVFDVRFLRNPYWDPALRALDGRSREVQDYVSADPAHGEFFRRISDLVKFLLPSYQAEGKAHLSIGFGCTGGQHRSVTLAEQVSNALAAEGWQVSTRHRELERRGAALPGSGAKS